MNTLPLVKSYIKKQGVFCTDKPYSISCLDDFIVGDLTSFLTKAGLGGNYFFELVDEKDIPAEGYRLEISSTDIKAVANDRQGLLYALQTMKQLVFLKKIECGSILDYPHKAYRGFMLDCGRYFYTVSEIKKFADLCLLHKLNVFHWHLCEDQGFRLEIKKYPLLTQIGSKRSHTNFNHTPHEGFYSQEDVKEIVAYFAERGIEVIPELEMPGHTQAMLAAYNHLGCFNRKLSVATHWGVKFDILCAGKESTYSFLEDVLSEIIELFPSKYIHLGGDEAPKLRWSKCPDCKRKLEELNLKNFDELQAYMVNRISDFLAQHGKTAIMWGVDNSIESFSPSIVFQVYSDTMQNQIDSLRQTNRKIVYSFCYDTYLDLPYKTTKIKNGYDANVDNIPVLPQNVLGIEAPLWTEYVPNYKKAMYMTLPRLGALSEAAWCNTAQKSYEDFLSRYDFYCDYMEFCGYKVSARQMIKNPPLKLTLQKLWFSRRPIHWEGIRNIIENNKVARIAKRLK